MSLFQECKAIQAEGKLAPAQLVETKVINMDEAETIVEGIAAKFPALKVNRAAIAKSIKAPTGEGGCVVAAANMRHPNGGMTLYYNGKLVLTGALVGCLDEQQ